MILKQHLIEKALELGFIDVGFTTTDPLDLYIREIESRPDMYDWVQGAEGVDLKRGALLSQNHSWAKSLDGRDSQLPQPQVSTPAHGQDRPHIPGR